MGYLSISRRVYHHALHIVRCSADLEEKYDSEQ